MEKLKIGRISGAQGLRGEVKLYHDSGEEEALRRLTFLFLRTDDAGKETDYRIEGLRVQKRTPIVKLSGVDDRNAAEALVGHCVYARIDEARPDEEDAWLVSELVGLEVWLAADGGVCAGMPIGRVKSIISNPAHDILEVETQGVSRLLPFIDVFVQKVDPGSGIVVVTPPEGWLD